MTASETRESWSIRQPTWHILWGRVTGVESGSTSHGSFPVGCPVSGPLSLDEPGSAPRPLEPAFVSTSRTARAVRVPSLSQRDHRRCHVGTASVYPREVVVIGPRVARLVDGGHPANTRKRSVSPRGRRTPRREEACGGRPSPRRRREMYCDGRSNSGKPWRF